MADEQTTTFEGAKYGSALKVKAGAAPMGDQAKVPRGAAVHFVGRGVVEAITFKNAGGVSVREHTAKPDELVLVPEDVVQDVIEEQREAETGQPRLLTDEGEVRRAGRAATRARALVLAEGGYDDADVTSASEFQERIAAHWQTLTDIETDVDTYEDPEGFWTAVEDELTFLAADLLAAVEWAHRQRAQVVEDKRLAAEVAQLEQEQAERDAARAAGEAAAISSDDVADSEAAKLNVDDDGTVDLEPAPPTEAELEALVHGEQADEGPVDDGAAYDPEVDPFEDEDEASIEPAVEADGEVRRMATEQQRVAISRHLMQAGGNEKLAQEWAEWCAGHDVPQVPAEMTFEQARKALVFLGDAENAEAGG